jgi:hypothetical protein
MGAFLWNNVPLVPNYSDLRAAQVAEQSYRLHKNVSIFSMLMDFLLAYLLSIAATQQNILSAGSASNRPKMGRMGRPARPHAKSSLRLDLIAESRRH